MIRLLLTAGLSLALGIGGTLIVQRVTLQATVVTTTAVEGACLPEAVPPLDKMDTTFTPQGRRLRLSHPQGE